VPPAPASAIVAALAQGPFKAYVVLLDLPRGRELLPEYFATPGDCYSTALMLLAERFHHLLAAEDDFGLIVVDSRFREDDSRLRRFFADLTESGTPFMKLDRIIEGLFLGSSHHSIGLQRVDLVTAIASSAERENGQARGYLKTLLPRFARHPPTGSLDGVGTKRFPDTVAPERHKRVAARPLNAARSPQRLRVHPVSLGELRCAHRCAGWDRVGGRLTRDVSVLVPRAERVADSAASKRR
jgi:hypothetical protein